MNQTAITLLSNTEIGIELQFIEPHFASKVSHIGVKVSNYLSKLVLYALSVGEHSFQAFLIGRDSL